jgi:hypothetical protein
VRQRTLLVRGVVDGSEVRIEAISGFFNGVTG